METTNFHLGKKMTPRDMSVHVASEWHLKKNHYFTSSYTFVKQTAQADVEQQHCLDFDGNKWLTSLG